MLAVCSTSFKLEQVLDDAFESAGLSVESSTESDCCSHQVASVVLLSWLDADYSKHLVLLLVDLVLARMFCLMLILFQASPYLFISFLAFPQPVFISAVTLFPCLQLFLIINQDEPLVTPAANSTHKSL